jgi:carboxypeptidase Taq
VVSLKRQEAQAIGYQADLYDALLDDYEPGSKTAEIRTLFANLRSELVPLAAAIAEAPRRPCVELLKREYPVELQRVFGETAASAIGFDFDRGRLDVTTHPFCEGIGPGDCRITTRYNRHFFNESFFGVLHEAGHGLYEQGLLKEHFGTPMGRSVSLGLHESQSRMWENAVGRSRQFWQYFFPIAQHMFRGALSDVSLDDFHFAVNAVEPSFIRVEADEVTYNLHILIRFELEQSLLAGELSIDDVPCAWNEKYTKYLGITPRSDAEGCLQDIHWAAGLFGYFPTYTLGNVYAAQLFTAASRAIGDLAEQFADGRFGELLQWLRSAIHEQGMRYRSRDLVDRVTGCPPNQNALVRSLREKYAPLYGLEA